MLHNSSGDIKCDFFSDHAVRVQWYLCQYCIIISLHIYS